MNNIYKSLLLMGVCSSATAPVMAITEEADTTRHQGSPDKPRGKNL